MTASTEHLLRRIRGGVSHVARPYAIPNCLDPISPSVSCHLILDESALLGIDCVADQTRRTCVHRLGRRDDCTPNRVWRQGSQSRQRHSFLRRLPNRLRNRYCTRITFIDGAVRDIEVLCHLRRRLPRLPPSSRLGGAEGCGNQLVHVFVFIRQHGISKTVFNVREKHLRRISLGHATAITRPVRDGGMGTGGKVGVYVCRISHGVLRRSRLSSRSRVRK